MLSVPDHSELGLQGELLKQWAYLDCFDMFAARFDSPKTIREVQNWFKILGIQNSEVEAGQLGFVVGRARISS